MPSKLKEKINRYAADRSALVGFAPVNRFQKAPDAHHPRHVCKDAETVIVFALPVPRGILRSPNYDLHTLHRSYHTVYSRLDNMALDLCQLIEAQTEALAVPVPSYAPMVFHGMEPWGILSLKHAAVNAGLGAFGRNGLVHHPKYGTMLRLGAVVTSAVIEGNPIFDDFPCPEKCLACHRACPSGAFANAGSFSKMTCLGHTIKHAIYPLALKDKEGLDKIERVINTAAYNYWLDCNRCLSVCPNNRPAGID